MGQAVFTHRISKGSRYNQIYVPSESENQFEVGDLVEVRLLEKKNVLYYSKNLENVGKFKEKLIEEVFAFLSNYHEVEQIFFFGSFLIKKIDYNDIDLLVVVKKDTVEIEKKISADLTERFNLKFHLVTLAKENFVKPLEVSPLARSMLYYFVSNMNFTIPKETKIEYNHIMLELMMPEDLLTFRFDGGKVYYDSLRKLICIEHFVRRKEIAPDKIDDELASLIDKRKIDLLKKDAYVEKKLLSEIRTVIKNKINTIHKLLHHGKKR